MREETTIESATTCKVLPAAAASPGEVGVVCSHTVLHRLQEVSRCAIFQVWLVIIMVNGGWRWSSRHGQESDQEMQEYRKIRAHPGTDLGGASFLSLPLPTGLEATPRSPDLQRRGRR
uniref:Uncharacterized protein n=1 Tax=Physcomitrium patens TaxID=3218 RepID=A0A2K1J521_PHYPA|nr:hypothetical protein PHYPA_022477 [Physcomitrium patens]